MEGKAELVNVDMEYKTRRLKLTFLVEGRAEEWADLLGRALRLRAVKWTQKRSLDANAYFHLLVGKIAEKIGSTNVYVHNYLISLYGQPEVIDGNLWEIQMRDNINYLELDQIHLQPTVEYEHRGSDLYRTYIVMRGSHTYDTAEMSRLIDGTVSEAKQLGIETMTPDELERMLAACQKKAS